MQSFIDTLHPCYRIIPQIYIKKLIGYVRHIQNVSNHMPFQFHNIFQPRIDFSNNIIMLVQHDYDRIKFCKLVSHILSKVLYEGSPFVSGTKHPLPS